MELQTDVERFVRAGLTVNNARARIEMPENRSNGEALVGRPRILAQDAGAVRANVNRIRDFIRGIVEAVELDEDLPGCTGFSSGPIRRDRHRLVFPGRAVRASGAGQGNATLPSYRFQQNVQWYFGAMPAHRAPL